MILILENGVIAFNVHINSLFETQCENIKIRIQFFYELEKSVKKFIFYETPNSDDLINNDYFLAKRFHTSFTMLPFVRW